MEQTSYREWGNGWAFTVEHDGCHVTPGTTFRFGRIIGDRPVVEYHQVSGVRGCRTLRTGETIASVRAFLISLGAIELERYEPGMAPLPACQPVI